VELRTTDGNGVYGSTSLWGRVRRPRNQNRVKTREGGKFNKSYIVCFAADDLYIKKRQRVRKQCVVDISGAKINRYYERGGSNSRPSALDIWDNVKQTS